MPLQATSGAASYDAFGGGVPVAINYIEDVFSTYLYTGDSTARSIVNGIDLSTKGGLIWTKDRGNVVDHILVDTVRGNTKVINSNNTSAQQTTSGTSTITGFNSNGYGLGTDGNVWVNTSSRPYASWTFRKQPKFFDIVTWTGTNSPSSRLISHSLGSQPGHIMMKRTDAVGDWSNWHIDGSLYREFTPGLNSTASLNSSVTATNVATSTSIDVWYTQQTSGIGDVNGATYVAYLFAHNAGGFGLTGTDNVISCGSFTTDAGGSFSVNLGYEPQWMMIKCSSAIQDWQMFDNMRGLVTQTTAATARLTPNSTAIENSTTNDLGPTATGFESIGNYGASRTYIYIAIRRGPMKVPTSGTSVFYPQAISQADNIDSTGVPFPPDLVNTFSRDGTGRASTDRFQFVDRLRGLGTPNNTFTASAPRLVSSDTDAENTGSSYVQLKADSQNITRGTGWNSASYGNWIDYFWRRAPSFFDEVCFIGTGVQGRSVTHNLTVPPEIVIIKGRNQSGYEWVLLSIAAPAINSLFYFNTTAAGYSRIENPDYFGNSSSVYTAPSSTIISLGSDIRVNNSGTNYVAYLFATCAGVSKVGSYTGNGSSQTINCGFTGGARFVLIKKSSGTGDWMVSDSARGIVSGNDPYLELNNTNAEVTGEDWLDTDSTGFVVNEVSGSNANTNGATYIFLAIA